MTIYQYAIARLAAKEAAAVLAGERFSARRKYRVLELFDQAEQWGASDPTIQQAAERLRDMKAAVAAGGSV